MKHIIALTFFLIVAIVQAKDALDILSDECAKEKNVPEDFIHRAEAGEFNEDPSCYSYCLFKKAGFLNDKEELQVEEVKKQVPALVEQEHKEESLAAIDACKDTQGKDICDRIFKIHRCYFQKFAHKH